MGICFPVGDYRPPTRIETDLTERQQEILQTLADGKGYRFQEIYQELDDPPVERTIRRDMQSLRDLGLIECSGKGPATRWRLKI